MIERAISERTSIVLDAIDLALDALAKMPESPDSDRLLRHAIAHRRRAARWGSEPPSREEREAMMNSVLALHATVSKLKRASCERY